MQKMLDLEQTNSETDIFFEGADWTATSNVEGWSYAATGYALVGLKRGDNAGISGLV